MTIMSDILQTISIIFAAWAVIAGVDAWKREFIGKRRIELVQDVLALFYEARDAISAIRSPFGFEGEGESREKKEMESPEETKARKRAYVAYERFEKRQEVFNKLHSRRYLFMATFGSESAKPFNDIHDVVNEIFNASWMLADEYWQPYIRNGMSEDEKKRHLEEKKKYERIFWRHSKDDPLSPRIESAIHTIENLAYSITQEKQSLYSLLTARIGKKSNN